MIHKIACAVVLLLGCAVDDPAVDTATEMQTSVAGGCPTTIQSRQFTQAGTYDFAVPLSCTKLSIRAWGGGGAGGATWQSTPGGLGGGGGYVRSVEAMVPGDVLGVRVGVSGIASSVRGSPGYLVIAAGGGGGGTSDTVGDGGAGGGRFGENGKDVRNANGDTAQGGGGAFHNRPGNGGVSSTGHDGGIGKSAKEGGYGGAPYAFGGRGGDGLNGGGGAAVTWYASAGGGGGASFEGNGATQPGHGRQPGGKNDPFWNGAGTGGLSDSGASTTTGLVVLRWGGTIETTGTDNRNANLGADDARP